MPWIVPHEFFEALPAWPDIPLALHSHAPQGMPDPAWHYPADVTEMRIPFNGTCNATRSRLYRRAYYAATAYQDYNIGAVLSALDELQLAESTLVVMFGDHGDLLVCFVTDRHYYCGRLSASAHDTVVCVIVANSHYHNDCRA